MTETAEPGLGEALGLIHAEGGISAVSLVADIVESNHRHLESTFEGLYESEKRDHERTKARLAEALDHLDLIHRRVAWLFGNDEPWGQP